MILDRLRIDALAFGGSGVGRQEGKVVFVPFTAPGDLARCRVTRSHRRYVEAELVELIEPAPERRPPPCPVFGVCGGCQWQHLPYPEQGGWKERLFTDLLHRQANVPLETVRSLVPAPVEWHYRSRVQLKCRQTGSGFVMGFYRRGSHFVVDVADCPITSLRLNEVLRLFRQWLPASPCPELIPQVDLETDDEGAVRATVHFIGADPSPLAVFLAPRAEEAGLSLFLQAGRKETLERVCGTDRLQIHPLGVGALRLAYGPGGFAQVNLEQNRSLVGEVLRAVEGRGRCLDLFCGMGNFSLPLAAKAAEVVGVEGYAPAIAMAKENAAVNGIGNVRFLARSAEEAVAELMDGDGVETVVLDPPRTGAYDVARELARRLPPRVVYVSCDPATLARDLVPLLHGGYRVVTATPLDLFPQTWHIESVTCIERI